MSQINQYPNEAFVINDEDFYDVDFWTGAAFESRKISGATLKSVLSALATNLYNSDGTLTGNRTVDLDGFSLTLGDATGSAVFNGERLILNGISAPAGIQLQAPDTEAKQVLFKSNNLDRFKISVRNFEVGGETGSTFFIECFDDLGNLSAIPLSIFRESGALTISNSYTLPTSGGLAGQVLTTDGLGAAEWVTPAAAQIEKKIDSSYAFDMSVGSGNWNGQNINATSLVTLSETIRLQAFSGTGAARGCYVNIILPSYYVAGSDIRVDLVTTASGVSGNIRWWCGLNLPTIGGLFGASNRQFLDQIVPVASGFPVQKQTFIFSGAGLVAGDPVSVLVYRWGNDGLDTFTGDSYLNTINVEQVI